MPGVAQGAPTPGTLPLSLQGHACGRTIFALPRSVCDRFIDRRSRTHDQMVQAARSGVQNIAEGSQTSGTSKKSELKLTGVARASLEELRLDYGDFLRQRRLAAWPPDHPALMRFKAKRCATLDEVRAWVADERKRGRTEHGRTQTDTDKHGPGSPSSPSVSVREGPCRPCPPCPLPNWWPMQRCRS